MRFEFDWDPAKAASNVAKHGVSFDEALGVFLDPLALSRLDDAFGGLEERWVTIGLSRAINLVVIVHTYGESMRITLTSASSPHADQQKISNDNMKKGQNKARGSMQDEYNDLDAAVAQEQEAVPLAFQWDEDHDVTGDVSVRVCGCDADSHS